MKKITFGRKFLAWVVVTAVLVAILAFVGILAPKALNATVLTTYGILVTTMGVAYIGGNVWKSWVKSKWFQSELKDT